MHWIKQIMAHLERRMTAVEHSKTLGTYESIDRSKQYTRADNPELLRAVNEAWTKIRANERAAASKDEITALKKELTRKIESRIWHRIVVIVAAAEFTLIVMLLEKFAR